MEYPKGNVGYNGTVEGDLVGGVIDWEDDSRVAVKDIGTTSVTLYCTYLNDPPNEREPGWYVKAEGNFKQLLEGPMSHHAAQGSFVAMANAYDMKEVNAALFQHHETYLTEEVCQTILDALDTRMGDFPEDSESVELEKIIEAKHSVKQRVIDLYE